MAPRDIDIHERARKVREECDFFDRIPLEGYFWEIVRRTGAYRDFYERAVALSKIFTHPATQTSESKSWNAFTRLLDKGYYFFSEGLWSLEGESIKDARDVNKAWAPYYVALHASLRHGRVMIVVPNPDIEYVRFVPWERPEIRGSVPVRYATWEDIVWKSVPGEEDSTLVYVLATGSKEETIFVGISPNSRIEDVQNALLARVRRLLKPVKRRRHPKKWKFYVITFDLHEKEELDFQSIADILSEAYPKVFKNPLGQNDTERFYDEADKLIVRERYRKYLFFD